MSETYRVIAKITELRSQPGKEPCDAFGYKVGDEFDLTDPNDCAKICKWALYAISPLANVLEFGGTFPWDPEKPHSASLCCPDADRPVVFELRREEIS